MPKRYVFAFLILALVGAGMYGLRRNKMLDPLKDSGLTDKEIRYFRYILSLHEYSGINLYKETPTDREAVRNFNQEYRARQCRVCGRVYADLDQSCPYFHGPTVVLTKDELDSMIEKWEGFRRDYCQYIGLKTMTRLWAIKLYWLTKYPLEH